LFRGSAYAADAPRVFRKHPNAVLRSSMPAFRGDKRFSNQDTGAIDRPRMVDSRAAPKRGKSLVPGLKPEAPSPARDSI
jgi:hypothetical protein